MRRFLGLDSSFALDEGQQVGQMLERDLLAIPDVLNPSAPMACRRIGARFPPDADDE
jgi:hypothetical protein